MRSEKGFNIESTGNLEIDLSDSFDLTGSEHIKRLCEKDPNAIASFNFLLLDLLLHQRTHDYTIENYHLYEENYSKTRLRMRDHHISEFLEIKETLRREVISYLTDKSIDLSEYMKDCIPGHQQGEPDIHYNIAANELKDYFYMTKKQLREKRMMKQWQRETELRHKTAMKQKKRQNLENNFPKFPNHQTFKN